MSQTLEVFTVGDVCRATGVPLHRVDYAIASRWIQPVRRRGAPNLYDAAAWSRSWPGSRRSSGRTSDARRHGRATPRCGGCSRSSTSSRGPTLTSE